MPFAAQTASMSLGFGMVTFVLQEHGREKVRSGLDSGVDSQLSESVL